MPSRIVVVCHAEVSAHIFICREDLGQREVNDFMARFYADYPEDQEWVGDDVEIIGLDQFDASMQNDGIFLISRVGNMLTASRRVELPAGA